MCVLGNEPGSWERTASARTRWATPVPVSPLIFFRSFSESKLFYFYQLKESPYYFKYGRKEGRRKGEWEGWRDGGTEGWREEEKWTPVDKILPTACSFSFSLEFFYDLHSKQLLGRFIKRFKTHNVNHLSCKSQHTTRYVVLKSLLATAAVSLLVTDVLCSDHKGPGTKCFRWNKCACQLPASHYSDVFSHHRKGQCVSPGSPMCASKPTKYWHLTKCPWPHSQVTYLGEQEGTIEEPQSSKQASAWSWTLESYFCIKWF